MANPDTNLDVAPALPAPELDHARAWTADEVRALNAANPRWWPRYECVLGTLIGSPSPGWRHYIVVRRLFRMLDAYLGRALPGALAVFAPADVSWGLPDVTVQPDVFALSPATVRAANAADAWRAVDQLLLAAEVVSPSSRHTDREEKRELYQRRGVSTYWVVDPELRQVEVWTPGATSPVVERERLAWEPAGASEPLVVDLTVIFADEERS